MSLTVTRKDDALVLTGALVRASVAGAWKSAIASIAGVRRFDLTGVSVVDSAGVALLAELAARAAGGLAIEGTPQGLEELRAAYRLDPSLAFANT